MTPAARREALRLLVLTATLRTSPAVGIALAAVGAVLLLALGAGTAAVFVDWALRRIDTRREVSGG